MARIRLQFVIPAALFLLIAGVFAAYLVAIGHGKDPSAIPSALIGKPAPDFTLPPIEGDGIGLSTADLAGKPSLVNVWASWCPPCRQEHPMLMRLAREGVTIYGIDYKDKPADAKRLLAELGNPFAKIGADRTGRTAIDWGVYGYPETFVIDRDGRIRYRHIGPILPQDIESKIRPMLRTLSQ